MTTTTSLVDLLDLTPDELEEIGRALGPEAVAAVATWRGGWESLPPIPALVWVLRRRLGHRSPRIDTSLAPDRQLEVYGNLCAAFRRRFVTQGA